MATLTTSYWRYRQWVNTQDGGYLEDYNLLEAPAPSNPYVTSTVIRTCLSICCLRGQLLDGTSDIANGEISLETLPGQNPPEGFQMPHAITGSSPILMTDPSSGSLETNVQDTTDPAIALAWRLDTQTGVSELRTLRSLRSSWIEQKGTLIAGIIAQLGAQSASLPARGSKSLTFPGGSTDPATCIAYFMLYVLTNTQNVQLVKSGGYVSGFSVTPFATPTVGGSNPVQNPILSTNFTRRAVGEGWPKTRGKMQTFGTSG